MTNQETVAHRTEVHLEPSRTSAMELFVKIINGFLFSQKNSIVDIRLGSKYTFEGNIISIFGRVLQIFHKIYRKKSGMNTFF